MTNPNPFATGSTATATMVPPQPVGNPFGAPAGQPQAAPAQLPGDPFGNPAPKSSYPRIRELSPIGTGGLGCLVLITPHSIVDGAYQGKPNRTMTCDIVVLDSPAGPVRWGGKPEKGIQHTQTQDTFPWELRQVKTSNDGISNACETALENRRKGVNPGVVLGRIGVGTQSDPTKNPPFIMLDPSEDDIAKARAYYASK